ncbi:DNA ligase D [Gracilibacillus caseinilyticus]|uniref:DNA ligase (ATP) n=1 Tax=Gracilibacillus caseinilyticus TaxID=2932256 RepID=A0ABY4ESQ6_9BACI|nr:DNA ligase D [Gracilibacillus caseinilyticus]UOQ47385.1 DNA ligase D [Gracilibacillus caseinilyticus]
MWKPMLPTLTSQVPTGHQWLYQIKYDGFRCGLYWDKKEITIISRNGHDLTASFPEITLWCKEHRDFYERYFPLQLDGEIVLLLTPYRCDFSQIQRRSKTKRNKKEQHNVTFIVFDLLTCEATNLRNKPFTVRDRTLHHLFEENIETIQKAPTFEQLEDVEKLVALHQAEGFVAKKKNAPYKEGKRSESWLKIKNYRTVQGVVTKWNSNNDYFTVSYYMDNKLQTLGKCKNGLKKEEKDTLQTFIKQNGKKVNGTTWNVSPSICLDIQCLDASKEELREPHFSAFRFDIEPEHCNTEAIKFGLAQIPERVSVSKLDKLLFPEYSKLDFLCYLRTMAPYMLPWINDRKLTIIRYPDGVSEPSFYQKHLPDYAPSFLRPKHSVGGDAAIYCQNFESLLWFGNHGGLEFHIPFNKQQHHQPDQIVFDLDPPSLKEFYLAVRAALLIKEMMEHQKLKPYIKTSGKTGLQIHIPVNNWTYQQTRELMEATSNVLIQAYPDQFTSERLIKNRGNRLYIDYVQHAERKTIIAPYSTRATNQATVATPLFWEEVTETLDPTIFTIRSVLQRIREKGCPFFDFYRHLE